MFYISQSGQPRVGHGMVPGYHIYVRCCCFPDLSHVNIQELKTHTVGNYVARPVLKNVQLNYKLNLPQYEFFTCMYSTLQRNKHIYCIYFYDEHGIDLGTFYLLGAKDLKEIFPTTMFGTMLTTRRALRQVNAYITKILQIFWAYSVFSIFNVSIQCQYFIVGKFNIQHWSSIGIYSAWIYLKSMQMDEIHNR